MTNLAISHHIFVDFENVPTLDLSLVRDQPVELLILLGAKQHNLPISLVKQLMQFKGQAQFIEVNISAKNALDFVLIYYLGQLACQKPDHSFYIISKDKGYDALVSHLHSKKVNVQRQDELADIPLFGQKVLGLKSKAELSSLERLTELLKQSPRNRPAKRQSLITYTNSVFARKLTTDEVNDLIGKLQQKKLISFDTDSKVIYSL